MVDRLFGILQFAGIAFSNRELRNFEFDQMADLKLSDDDTISEATA